ncbi:unnamed protein product, partial [Anisakis simplex]|uniref:Uncharacterized protein n=1 Tax=Anisakis simplex TaxID=6269 RepID=A0A0M3JQF3_ANISI
MGMGPYRRGYHHPPMMMMGSNWGFPMRGVGMWRGRGNNAEDDVSGGSSEEEGGGAIVLQSGEDPFLAMHRKMHEDMMRFHQIADRLLSLDMDRDRDSGENSAENERANSKEDKM